MSSSAGSGKVKVNGQEVQSNSSALQYFPRDKLVRDITPAKLSKCIHLNTAACYVLFIPQLAYIPGARTFTQFDRSTGKMYRTLLELFCVLSYRKQSVQFNNLQACQLVVERAVGPQKETRGWFFFLYDNVVESSTEKEPKKTQISVPAYIKAVITQLDMKMFDHLVPGNARQLSTVARPTPFDFWPAIQDMRVDKALYQRMVMFYLDITGDTMGIESISRMTELATHDLSPSNAFTLENAVRHYNRCYGCAWHNNQTITSTAEFTAKFPRHPQTRAPMPSNPAETTLMTPSVLLPQVLAMYMKPEDQYKPDLLTPDYLVYAAQHRYSNRTPEENLARFEAQIGTVLGVPAHVTMADFFASYREKIAATRTVEERQRVARAGYTQWSSVWNPLMAEGSTYAAMVEWGSATLRSSPNRNFCLSMRIADPTVSVIGNVVASLYQSIDVFKGVASAHQMILTQILMMHSASYLPGNSKNLVSSFMKAGPAAASKTFADHVSKALCVPSSALDVAYATDKAGMSADNQRGYIHVIDEINMQQLGADKIHHKFTEFFDSIINPPAVSMNMTEGLAKNSATNQRERTVLTAIISDSGRRTTTTTVVNTYGVKSANTNAGPYDLAPATASRWLFYMTRNDEGNSFDGLDKMTAAHFSKMDAVCSKNFRSISQWMHRNHYLSTLMHIMTEARILPEPDQSLFCRRYNMLTHYLQRRGMPLAREKRHFEKIWQVTLQLLHWEVITKVFDMGIGGPDPSRPFRESDLELVLPFWSVDDPISVMAMELTPSLNDRVLFSTMQIIREKILLEQNLQAFSTRRVGYYVNSTYFNSLTDQRTCRKCEYLANDVVARGSPYDIRTVFAALAKLTKLQVPMLDARTGRVGLEAGWLPDVAGLCIHRKLIDNLASEDVIFNAFNAVVELGGEPLTVVRGASVPGDPSTLQVGTLTGTPVHVESKAEAKELEWGVPQPADAKDLPAWQSAKAAWNVASEEQKLQLKKQQAEYDKILKGWELKNKQQVADLERMEAGVAKDLRHATVYADHPGARPMNVDAFNPKTMKNPNYRDRKYIASLGKGTLGVGDADAVTSLLKEQKETMTAAASDRDDMVENHLLGYGIDPMGRTHFAFPRVTQRLVERYDEANTAVNTWRCELKKHPTEMSHDQLRDCARLAVNAMCRMWNAYRRARAMPEPLNHPGFIDAWLKKRLVDQPQGVVVAMFKIWEAWPQHIEPRQLHDDHPAYVTLAAEVDSFLARALEAAGQVEAESSAVAVVEDEAVPMDVQPSETSMLDDVQQVQVQPQAPAPAEHGVHSTVGFDMEAGSDEDEEDEDDGGEHERQLQARARARQLIIEREEAEEAELKRKQKPQDDDDDNDSSQARRRAQVREDGGSNSELKHSKSKFAFAARARPPAAAAASPARPLARQLSIDENDTAMCITPLN